MYVRQKESNAMAVIRKFEEYGTTQLQTVKNTN